METCPQAVCTTKKTTNKFDKFINLFKYTSEDEFNVTWMQFVCTSFMLTMPANYLIFLIRIFTHGGLFIYGLIILFTFLCALPLNLFYSFVGLYTGYSYLKMWRIAPVFAGVGVTIWLMPFADAVDNLYLANLAMNYTITSLQANLPWKSCDFDKSLSHDECRNFNPLVSYTQQCCNESTEICEKKFPFPALVYFAADGKDKSLIPRFINYTIFAVCMLINVRRYMGFMTILTVVFAIMLIPVLYISIYYGQSYMMPTQFNVLPKDMHKNILYAYIFSLYREIPAGTTGLGSMINPKNISLTNSLLAVYSVKVIIIGLVFVWQIVGILILQKSYKIEHITCLLVDAHELYYASIPDLMTKWHVPQIWLIFWFLLLYFWSMVSSIHILTFNLNAVIDVLPQLKPCRNVICLVLIIMLAILDFTFAEDAPLDWKYANRLICCVVFVVVSITILKYGIKRLCVDFYFVYEYKLSNAWTSIIKISLLLNMFLAVFCLTFMMSESLKEPPTIIFAVFMIPIIVGILWRFFRAILKKNVRVVDFLKESSKYSYRDPLLNEQRKKFNVEKKTKFSSHTLHCRHRCIIEIKDTHPEVQRVEKHKMALEEIYREIKEQQEKNTKKTK